VSYRVTQECRHASTDNEEEEEEDEEQEQEQEQEQEEEVHSWSKACPFPRFHQVFISNSPE